jgi:adenine-specific DNA-methyltransferase
LKTAFFEVDINPNSVKICRLRLWIELLKNAYYKNATELETLPNIDINIKCGNSLVSRFNIDADLKKALKKSKWTIDSYRIAVSTYRNAQNKEQKREMEHLIDDIKSDFRSEISKNDPKVIKQRKLSGELFQLTNQGQLFEMSKKEKAAWNKKVKKLTEQTNKLEAEIEEIKANKIFENAFEWRFEFPEVLNDEGDFVGFDVVIGNPPYINFANLPQTERDYYKKFELYKNKTDLYAFFVGLGTKIKNDGGLICLIISHTWVSTTSFLPLRELFVNHLSLRKIVEFDFGVFKDAYVKTVIIQTDNEPNNYILLLDEDFKKKVEIPIETIKNDEELKINLTWTPEKHKIYNRIKSDSTKLGDIIHFSRGIKTSNDKRFLFKEEKGKDYYKIIRGRNIKAYRIDYDGEYIWYRPDLMKEKAGCLPHTKELFLTPEKIITQRVNSSGQLLATFDNDQFICLDTTNVSSEIIDPNYDLRYIVGVMNSKLINWWFNDEFKNPTISGYELHQIPIKKGKKKEKQIADFVSQIIKNIKIGKDAEKFIEQIDQLVYQLYGLTEEEIEIVEGK